MSYSAKSIPSTDLVVSKSIKLKGGFPFRLRSISVFCFVFDTYKITENTNALARGHN